MESKSTFTPLFSAGQRWFWLLVALLSPVIPLQAYLAGNWYSVLHSYSLGMVFGIASYIWFANTLILSARIPYIDRLYGQDRVMVFHGYLAMAALISGGVHAILKFIYFGVGTFQVHLGIVAFILFTSVMVLTLLFMAGPVIYRLQPVVKLRGVLGRRPGFDYSNIKLFHNVTGIAMLFVTVHVLLATPSSESLIRLGLTGAWGGLSVVVWLNHKITRVFLRRRQAMTVSRVENLTADIVKITGLPGGRIPTFRPGQFGYFHFLSEICGREEHPFTIASAPHEPELAIVVKELGDYTRKLKAVSVGTSLVFDGPYGRFTPVLNHSPHLFIAGGIGITPFMSILKAWGRQQIERPVALIWTVRRKSDFVDDGFFESLARENPAFHYVPIPTREAPFRHLDLEVLSEILHPPEMAGVKVYMCGPDRLRKSCIPLLKGLGVKLSHIHYESFGA